MVLPAGVMIITAVVFIRAIHGEFLTWDDDHNFLTNMAFRGLDAANLRWMFTTFHLGPYQPLSWLSLGWDYSIWGMNPYGYHLTNLVLHVANAGLAYAVALAVFTHAGEPRPRPSRDSPPLSPPCCLRSTRSVSSRSRG